MQQLASFSPLLARSIVPKCVQMAKLSVLSRVVVETFDNGFVTEKRFKLPPPTPKRLAPKIDAAIFQKERRDDPIPLANVLKFLQDGSADQYIYAWIRLNLDSSKKNYSIVSGKATLPRGVLPVDEEADTEKILVFATGQAAEDATKAGASLVGGPELVVDIANGDVDLSNFSRVIATPEMYQETIKIAKIIGPMGLMPNKQKGTVTDNVALAVTTLKSESKIPFQEKDGEIAVEVAKSGWTEEEVYGNLAALLESVIRSNTNKRKYMVIASVRLGYKNGSTYRLALKPFGPVMRSIRFK